MCTCAMSHQNYPSGIDAKPFRIAVKIGHHACNICRLLFNRSIGNQTVIYARKGIALTQIVWSLALACCVILVAALPTTTMNEDNQWGVCIPGAPEIKFL